MDNVIQTEAVQVNRCGCKLCKENFEFEETLKNDSSTVTGTVVDTSLGMLVICSLVTSTLLFALILAPNVKLKMLAKLKKQLRYRVYGHKNSCKSKSEQILYKHNKSDV